MNTYEVSLLLVTGCDMSNHNVCHVHVGCITLNMARIGVLSYIKSLEVYNNVLNHKEMVKSYLQKVSPLVNFFDIFESPFGEP